MKILELHILFHICDITNQIHNFHNFISLQVATMLPTPSAQPPIPVALVMQTTLALPVTLTARSRAPVSHHVTCLAHAQMPIRHVT